MNKEKIKDLIISLKKIKHDDEDEVKEYKLVSWPYSRKLVSTTLDSLNIACVYKRLNKRFDVFNIRSKNAVDVFIHVIKEINKNSDKENFTKSRNDSVDLILSELKCFVDTKEEKIESNSCHGCESKNVTKNGKDSKGIQKLKCKDCGHNFKKN